MRKSRVADANPEKWQMREPPTTEVVPSIELLNNDVAVIQCGEGRYYVSWLFSFLPSFILIVSFSCRFCRFFFLLILPGFFCRFCRFFSRFCRFVFSIFPNFSGICRSHFPSANYVAGVPLGFICRKLINKRGEARERCGKVDSFWHGESRLLW